MTKNRLYRKIRGPQTVKRESKVLKNRDSFTQRVKMIKTLSERWRSSMKTFESEGLKLSELDNQIGYLSQIT